MTVAVTRAYLRRQIAGDACWASLLAIGGGARMIKKNQLSCPRAVQDER